MNTALAGFCLALLTTLIGVVWKAAKVVAKLEADREAAAKYREDLEKRLAELDEIPLLRQRVGDIHTWSQGITRAVAKVRERMSEVRGRLASSDDLAKALSESVDSDPPPGENE